MKRRIQTDGYDVVVFDCDSTLSAVEGIDLIAKRHGVEKEVERITHQAMNGNNNFAKALKLRLQLVQPTEDDLIWLGHQYIKKTIKGAKKLIKILQEQNKDIYIISGGFGVALNIFANYLNIDNSHVFCNTLIFDDKGMFCSYDKTNPLAKNHGKRIILKKLASKGSTVFIGDGITDLEAKDEVDLFIGFGGVKIREAVKKNADLFIQNKTLNKLMDIIIGKK